MNRNYSFRDDRRSQERQVGRSGQVVDTIVIHHWGKDGQNWDNLTAWLLKTGRNVSSHYIAESGRVERQVDVADTAWHAGYPEINRRSIGIECRPEATDSDYDTISELIADIWHEHGRLEIKPHSDFVPTACPGRYNLARLETMADDWHAKKYEKKEEPEIKLTTYRFSIPYRVAREHEGRKVGIQGYREPLWRGERGSPVKRYSEIIQSVERADDPRGNSFVKDINGYWYLVKAEGRWQVSDARPKVNTYTVGAGDTLWSIAQSELGSGMRWTQIAEVNSLRNTIIHVGQVLTIPER